MNIQKMVIDDEHSTALATRGNSAPSVMAVPEVASPRANPLAMIWRRRGVLAIVLAVCLATAFVKYAFTTKIYQSRQRVLVKMNNLRGAGESGPQTTMATELQRQCDRIKSVPVLNEVRAALAPANLKTFDTNNRWRVLSENLNATVQKDNSLIEITFDSPYPKEAKIVVGAVVDAYANFHENVKRADVGRLEKAKRDLEGKIEVEEAALLKIKKESGQFSLTGEKGNLETQKLASLQDALTQKHIEVVNDRGAYDVVKGKLNNPVELRALADYLRATNVVVGIDPAEQTLRKQLFDMEDQLNNLRTRLLPEHPAVRSSEATVAQLKVRVAEMDRALAERYIQTLGQKLVSSEALEADLQKSYEEQKKVAIVAAEFRDRLDSKEKTIKRLQGYLDNTMLSLLQFKETEADIPTIEKWELEADEPTTPLRPVLAMMLFQGLAIGLVLGCIAALVRDWTDQGLRSAEEISEATGVPLLGSVPHIPGPPNPMAAGRKVDLEPASDVAEMYRTIRTAVFFGTPDRESRTILVTSPAPGDGKSTFASNLAIAMAQTGKRVLLVDCDFRRPVQHRVFECRPGAGMSSVLMGKESLDHAIQSTGISGLDILPAGQIPTNPSEMLNSQSFTEVLEELSVRYEHVVVDSPPVMAVADARILAAMCSVTILVLRAESSTRKAALHSRRALESVGAHILGVVVNDVPRARDRYGEYGGYSSYRAKYNGHSAAATHVSTVVTEAAPSGSKSSAIIPAQSFLDLRKK